MTHRYELEVRSVVEPPQVVREGYHGEQRVAVVRERGKRKEFYLDLAADDILLDGWDAPFRADTECDGVMAGNAMTVATASLGLTLRVGLVRTDGQVAPARHSLQADGDDRLFGDLHRRQLAVPRA